MRRPLVVCGSAIKVADSSTPATQSANITPSASSGSSSPMERMKKILSSPLNKRKAGVVNKTFGVPLSELLGPNSDVPFLVKKICEFIQFHGIGHEGIFRVNGNARVVEKLKSSFDKTGDADLEEAGDVMAVAGLLKLFLRELPDSVIPENETKKYIQVHEELGRKPEECTAKLKELLTDLPADNYRLLQYLSRFLVLVSQKEENNKMSPMALGIVFGPNLFKCTDGIAGLKEQGVTNQIVCKFIQNYETLFEDRIPRLDVKDSPPRLKAQNHLLQVQEATASRTPPPRPPPPKFEMEVTVPVPSPRRSKNVKFDSTAYQDDDWEDDSRHTPQSHSTTQQSPRYFSDDEYLDPRSASPFVLDSEGGGSTMTSPIIETVASEVVQNVIKEVTCGYLFGSDTDLESEEEKENALSPIPAPRKKKKEKQANGDLNGSYSQYTDDRPELDRRQRSTSAALEMFENQNNASSNLDTKPNRRKGASSPIQIPDDLSDGFTSPEPHIASPPVPKPRSPRKKSPKMERHYDEDDDFDIPEEGTTTLNNFRRAAGPKRRTPSRKLRHATSPDNFDDIEAIDEERGSPDFELPALKNNQDMNHNDRKGPSTNFLDVPYHDGPGPGTPDKSPSAGRKTFVPPLDLSILHEHVDGGDAILAEKGPSLSFQKAKVLKDEEEEALLSPRSQKLKKKNRRRHCRHTSGNKSHSAFKQHSSNTSANTNTDVPPSPPAQQPTFFFKSTRQEDDHTAAIRQLNMRIHSFKKKIKQFEDNFEESHGYRPSPRDKSAVPEIKKEMTKLAKAKKELKQLKEEAQRVIANDHLSETHPPSRTRPSDVKQNEDSDHMPSMEQTLQTLLKKLSDKRREATRPEDLALMTRDQIQNEKLAVQKALLNFESIHGRPVSRPEKELMRPLYDRYRNIKRLLARPMSPRDKELEPVPEGYTMDFSPGSGNKMVPIKVPTGEPDEEMGSGEFAVTQNLALLNNTLEDVENKHKGSYNGKPGSNLHELSVSELLDIQTDAKNEKKKLRKILRDFEEEFSLQNGRKVQKEDRVSMEAEYNDYKKIKAKLRLLEALISKHDPTSTI